MFFIVFLSNRIGWHGFRILYGIGISRDGLGRSSWTYEWTESTHLVQKRGRGPVSASNQPNQSMNLPSNISLVGLSFDFDDSEVILGSF